MAHHRYREKIRDGGRIPSAREISFVPGYRILRVFRSGTFLPQLVPVRRTVANYAAPPAPGEAPLAKNFDRLLTVLCLVRL